MRGQCVVRDMACTCSESAMIGQSPVQGVFQAKTWQTLTSAQTSHRPSVIPVGKPVITEVSLCR